MPHLRHVRKCGKASSLGEAYVDGEAAKMRRVSLGGLWGVFQKRAKGT